MFPIRLVKVTYYKLPMRNRRSCIRALLTLTQPNPHLLYDYDTTNAVTNYDSYVKGRG